jgi:hypothetical protein
MPRQLTGEGREEKEMVHIKVWSGSGCARITDMENAGKKGKTCKTLRISGTSWGPSDHETPEQKKARKGWEAISSTLEMDFPESRRDGEIADRDYAAMVEWVKKIVSQVQGDGVPVYYLQAYDEEIKGIHAPKPPLTAGVSGKWSAGANENGISLHELDDPNEWTEITPHDQSDARAYDIARKVWDKVKEAQTMREAANILRAAGAKLHGYCAMD